MQLETRALARAEAKQEMGRQIGREAAEILGNIDAMQLAIERAVAANEVNETYLLDIHRLLLARAANSRIAGRFRDVQNWIGGNDYNPCGAAFVPPPPEQVPLLLADLCAFCNDETLPALVQAAIAHAQFETIHPFEDGNGRAVRRGGGAGGDAGQPLRGRGGRAQDPLARRRRPHIEAPERRGRVGPARRAPGSPYRVGPVGAAATGRSKPAIANAVAELEAAGVLSAIRDSVRNRAWEASELLDLVAGLEAGLPPSSSGDRAGQVP